MLDGFRYQSFGFGVQGFGFGRTVNRIPSNPSPDRSKPSELKLCEVYRIQVPVPA